MAENSKIEWTDATWNPVLGCDKISPGCKNCYAIRTAWRLQHNPNPKVAKAFEGLTVMQGGQPNWTGRVNFVPGRLNEPLKWGKPRRVFVNSQSDLFHEDIPIPTVLRIFEVMAQAKQHTFQILTKRPERMKYLLTYGEKMKVESAEHHRLICTMPLPNVWLGVSVENQKYADERIPLLLQTPAVVRWVSAEPLLGPIDLDSEDAGGLHALGCGWDGEGGWKHCPDRAGGKCEGIDWVVAGGESGPGARPMHPDWARSLRDQCKAAGVAFFFKQWGEHVSPYQFDHDGYDDAQMDVNAVTVHPDGIVATGWDRVWRVGKKAAGRLLDGVEHSEYPEAHAH